MIRWPRRGTLVLVRWEDHHEPELRRWRHTVDGETEPLILESFGWIVARSRGASGCVVIASERMAQYREVWRGLTTILVRDVIDVVPILVP